LILNKFSFKGDFPDAQISIREPGPQLDVLARKSFLKRSLRRALYPIEKVFCTFRVYRLRHFSISPCLAIEKKAGCMLHRVLGSDMKEGCSMEAPERGSRKGH
jgi:hypothetical protein